MGTGTGPNLPSSSLEELSEAKRGREVPSIEVSIVCDRPIYVDSLPYHPDCLWRRLEKEYVVRVLLGARGQEMRWAGLASWPATIRFLFLQRQPRMVRSAPLFADHE